MTELEESSVNPIVIYRILAASCGLLGAAGVAFGVDQHVKRRQEQEANHAHLQGLEEEFASKEAELASLISKLGAKNDQVRILAAEIEMRREQASALRGSE